MNCKNRHRNINHKNIFKRKSAQWEQGVDNFFNEVEKRFDAKIKNTVIENFTTPKEVREVAEMVNAYRADSVELAKNANKISTFLAENLSDEDSIALTRALGGDGEVPTHLKEVYNRFRKIIDQNAKHLVENGALLEENSMKDYLKRYYKQYLEEKKGFSIAMSKVFKRQDLTLDERLELGLVENADFVVANTILEQNRQLKKANLLKRIADSFAVDAPMEGYKKVSDESVGGGIKKYGALAGKYVPNRVYGELVGARMLSDTMSLLHKSIWTDIIDHVKINVTVKNPGTHLYNILSNMQLAYLNGDLGALAKVAKMMLTDREKFKKLVNLARKFGLNNEIEDYESFRVWIDVKKNSNPLVKVLKNIYMAKGTATGEAVRRVYGLEDEIFKLASFYRRIEGRKMSTATAKAEFQEAMADYVDYATPLPPIVRALDKNGVFPFSHYVWKSTPRVAKIIVKNPVKFALLQYALVEMGASVFGEDDNLEKPEWAEDKGFAGIAPFVPSNLFAAKQWVQLEEDQYINVGRALPGMRLGGLAFDGGFVGGFLSIAQGRDPLWKSKIYKESDSPLQATFKGLQKFAENYAPPLTYGRYGQRLAKKYTEFKPKTNDYKEEMDYQEILVQMLGVRKFNSPKHIKAHYKAVIKEFIDGNIEVEEMDMKLRAILIYAEEHGIDLDVSKIREPERNKDWSWWERWFI